MKLFLPFFTMLLVSFGATSLSAQCPPSGELTILSNADIADFVATYPNCTEITGTLSIGGTAYSPALTDLSGLSQLTTVGGNLFIGPINGPLDGLEGLTSVGGRLTIAGNQFSADPAQKNPSITTLAPLANVATIGGRLLIRDNSNLTSFGGFNPSGITDLFIVNNASLSDCSLSGLCAATGTLTISGNGTAVTPGTCENVQAFTNGCFVCPTDPTEETILVTQADVDAFVAGITAAGCTPDFGGALSITSLNGTLLDLSGLSGITSVAGPLTISGLAPDAADQLSGITSTGGLTIVMTSLTDLSAFSALTTINGPVIISENASLTDISALDGVTGITDLTIVNNASLNDCTSDATCDRSGTATVDGNGSGNCATQASFEGACEFCQVDATDQIMLNTQSAIDAFVAGATAGGCLTMYPGSIQIFEFPGTNAFDLSGLSALTEVAGELNLVGLGPDQFADLTGLTSVGSLNLAATTITSLDGLSSLTTINGPLTISQSSSLADISALDAVEGITDLTISGNPSLDNCTVAATCEASGTVTISNNGTGTCTNEVTFAAGCLALPVELMAFDGNYTGKTVALAWETSSEDGNEGFNVQRSPDGATWNTIGFVTGRNTAAAYGFTDERPLNGANFYRLEQRDFDGQTALSFVVTVMAEAGNALKLFPNPATEQLTVRFATEGNATVSVFNASGQLQFTFPMNSGTLPVDVSTLTSGVYLLSVTDGEQTTATRFVKR